MLGYISNWILSIVGVVIIGVLVDLILPEGEMQKYIKTIFSVIVVVIMISPVLNINIDNINFDKFLYNETSVELNEEYLNKYNDNYRKSLEEMLETLLKTIGFAGVDVKISTNLSNKNFEIEKVCLDIKNLVINVNSVHIDKYKEMRAIVVSVLNIKESRVVFNG